MDFAGGFPGRLKMAGTGVHSLVLCKWISRKGRNDRCVRPAPANIAWRPRQVLATGCCQRAVFEHVGSEKGPKCCQRDIFKHVGSTNLIKQL